MLGDPELGETGKGMGLYWRIEKKTRELESECGSVVGATGALYAVRRELLVPLPEGTILDDVYIPMQVVRQQKRVVFEPRARAWDTPDLGDGLEFARKVRTLSGNYQLVQLAPWLVSGEKSVALPVRESQNSYVWLFRSRWARCWLPLYGWRLLYTGWCWFCNWPSTDWLFWRCRACPRRV